MLRNSSNVEKRNGGWLIAKSGTRSCKTGRFEFKAGRPEILKIINICLHHLILGNRTEIFMEDHTGCKDFKMNRNESMSIEVKKEAGANISLNQVILMLEYKSIAHIFFLRGQNLTRCINIIFKAIAIVHICL